VRGGAHSDAGSGPGISSGLDRFAIAHEGGERQRDTERQKEREKGGRRRLVRAIRGKARGKIAAESIEIDERMIWSRLLYYKCAISAISVRSETRNAGCNRIGMPSRKSSIDKSSICDG